MPPAEKNQQAANAKNREAADVKNREAKKDRGAKKDRQVADMRDRAADNDIFSPEAEKKAGEKAIKQFEAELAVAHEREARRRKIPKEALGKGRTTPIAVRFDEFTLKRLRVLAARRNTGYQTLLKEFVVERLYEEEKREGLVE